MSKVGPSRAAAERALKAEFTSRQAPGGVGAVHCRNTMATSAEAWIEADHGWSTGTQRTYRSVVTKQVKPAFGQLCIREVTSGVVSRALSAVVKSSGPALTPAAHPARSACPASACSCSHAVTSARR